MAGEEEHTDEGPTVEEQAAAKGWKPKEEFEGPEGEWVPAKEFMERNKLYDAISSANNKIKNLEKTMEEQNKHFSKIKQGLKEQHERQLASLKDQLNQAAEEGDKKKVSELNDQIVEHHKQVDEDASQAGTGAENDADEYHKEWLKDNDWYGVDDEKTNYAQLVASGLLARYSDAEGNLTIPVEKVYERLDKEMEARFGEPSAGEPNLSKTPVSGKSKRGGSTGKSTVSQKYNQLTEQQKKVCDMFARQGTMTKEEYIKDLEEAGYFGEEQ